MDGNRGNDHFRRRFHPLHHGNRRHHRNLNRGFHKVRLRQRHRDRAAAFGHDLCLALDDCAWSIDDDHVEYDQRHILHSIGRVVWNLGYKRLRNGDAVGSRYGNIYTRLHWTGRKHDQFRDSDGNYTDTGCHYLCIAFNTRAWSIDDDHVETSNVTSCTASGAWSGTQAVAGSITETPTAIGTTTYTLDCTGPGGSLTNSAAVTVTAPPLPTVTISASPSTIALGASTTITWSTTGATSCTASGAWSGTWGTSGAASETPSAIGTAIYTFDCTGPGGSTTNSATVTVTAPPLPNSTAVAPTRSISTGAMLFVGGILTGSNYANTDTIYRTGFDELQAWNVVNSDEITLEMAFGANDWSPGWLTFASARTRTIRIAGPRNRSRSWDRGTIARHRQAVNILFDQAQSPSSTTNGYVRKYKSDGTADGSFYVGSLFFSIAVDNKTGNVLLDGHDYDENGGVKVAIPKQFPSSTADVVAVAAENGYGCFTQPSNNSASCYDLTGGNVIVPVVSALNMGVQPEAIAMGTFGSETDCFVVSVNDASSFHLHKVRASDAYAGEVPPLALPGTTPASGVVAANPVAGGAQAVVLDNGPASGTIAVLSTYDQLLLFVDESTWTVTWSVKLSGTPFRIFADTMNGNVIVAYANPESVKTTYASVDALSGTVTPLTSTSSLLSVGGVVSSDGTKLFLSMRDQMDIQPNN